MSTVAERVAAGAALLDEHAPDWADRLDLDRLNIRSCQRCILGQLFGYYFTGLDKVGLSRDSVAQSEEHGFSVPAFDVRALNAEWARVVEARREQARAES